jgi:predicted ATPase
MVNFYTTRKIMTERLIIENFGPINKVDIDIKRFMLFIGTQASGKSTIAKLLAIFRNIEIYVKDSLDSFDKEDQAKYFNYYSLTDYFQGDRTKFTYSNENYTIKYFNKKWEIIKTEKFSLLLQSEKIRVENAIRGVVESNDRLKSTSEKEQKETFQKIYDFNWKNLFVMNSEQIYIPADRILVSMIKDVGFSFRSVALPGSLQEFGTKFEFATKRIKEFAIDVLNITYKFEENKGHQIYYNDTNSISLSDSASGIQALLPLQLVIEYLSNNSDPIHHLTFIVEEPELNLFPETQKNTLSYLLKKCNQKGRKDSLVITTHSPYILSCMNNLLFAYDIAKNNKSKDAVREIIKEDFWVNPDEFSAYSLNNGTAESIFDLSERLISGNFLDSISEEINDERNLLMELYQENEQTNL